MRSFKFLVLGILLADWTATARAAEAPVMLHDRGGVYVLDNGIVAAQIDKQSGGLLSLRYKGLELLGRSHGYWSLPGSNLGFGSRHVPVVRADPALNGGKRATVSCKFTYDGRPGTIPMDVELCYSLGRGESALYLFALLNHRPNYPALSFGVGRFAAMLNSAVVDYMAIDALRQKIMPAPSDWASGTVQNMKEARLLTTGRYAGEVEHKYDYSAVQYDTPAYGWASTASHVGIWMVTASNEYMSGGCTKEELTAHLDANPGGLPYVLNVWKGPHYGGSSLSVGQSESWSKCIGPFLLYCNSAADGPAMWQDAMAQAAKEAAAWPYGWVDSPGIYMLKQRRSTVTGRISLDDPVVKQSQTSHLMVGLADPSVDWQKDAQYYEFWVHGDADGHFSIPNVRPGKYTLHAFATGVLGEFAKANIEVGAAKPLDLGTLDWKPVRYGTQLWEIGIPDRTAGEFLHGDHYWQWGLYNQYAKDFPTDVHYVIGKSDFHKDWNIMQVPHAQDQTGRSRGEATTWSVAFSLPEAPHGKATLRLAFAGTEARSLQIAINDKPAGELSGLPNTMAIHRDSDRSYWAEHDVAFDASLMHVGDNTMKLTVPAGGVTAGVEYDYLRLELDSSAKPPASPIVSPSQAAPTGGNEGGDE